TPKPHSSVTLPATSTTSTCVSPAPTTTHVAARNVTHDPSTVVFSSLCAVRLGWAQPFTGTARLPPTPVSPFGERTRSALELQRHALRRTASARSNNASSKAFTCSG